VETCGWLMGGDQGGGEAISTAGPSRGGRRITKDTKVREHASGRGSARWRPSVPGTGRRPAVAGTAGSETRAEQRNAGGIGEETWRREFFRTRLVQEREMMLTRASTARISRARPFPFDR
jgi:hypothetical protein